MIVDVPDIDPDVLLALPAGCYERFSRNPNGTNDSVGNQRDGGDDYCGRTWPPRKVLHFSDDGISASDEAVHRPGFEAFLIAIRTGKVGAVVAKSQARLIRNEPEFAELRRASLEAGIEHWHLWGKGGIQDIGRGKAIKAKIDLSLDSDYGETVSVNVRSAQRTLATKGVAGGGVCFGLIRGAKPTKGGAPLIPDPEVKGVPQEIFDRVLAGEPVSAIAADLNRRGIPTSRKGAMWRPSNIRRMLTAETLAGRRVYKGKVVAVGEWKPVVRPETFDAVKAMLARPGYVVKSNGRPAQRGVRRSAPTTYLWSNIARCGLCQTTLTGTVRSGGRTSTYVCHSSRGGCDRITAAMPGFDAEAERQFLSELNSEEYRKGLASGDPFVDIRHEVANNIEGVRARRKLDAADELSGKMSRETYMLRAAMLDEQEADLRTQQDAIPAPTGDINPDDLLMSWREADLNEKRRIIFLAVDYVGVGPATRRGNKFEPERVKVHMRTL